LTRLPLLTASSLFRSAARSGRLRGWRIPLGRRSAGSAGCRHCGEQAGDFLGLEFFGFSAMQAARQFERAVAHAHQAADRQPDRLEHAAHLAVSPFGNGDAVPVVRPFATAIGQGVELRGTVFEFDATGQPGNLLVAQLRR
jgi:hypothetical protein